MKLFCFAILFLSILTSSLGQTNTKVDQLKGFKVFTFDSTPEEYNGNLRLDLTISYGLKYYKYTGKEARDIHGFKASDINVGFRDDRLEYIDFYFKKIESSNFEELFAKLSETFGTGEKLENPDEKGVVQAVEWKGKKVLIQLYRYDDTANDTEDRNKTVLMINDPNI